jgi:hypothetical protein
LGTRATTPEDHAYFEFLAPLRWPDKPLNIIEEFRQLMITGDLQIETVLENALVVQSDGLYTREAGIEDFSGTWGDAKKTVTQWRNNDIGRGSWMNSAPICKINTKAYMLRIMCYSKFSKQFYFYAIPNAFYQGIAKIEITFDQFSNTFTEPTPLGLPKDGHKWNDFMVADFKELATVTEDVMTARAFAAEYRRHVTGKPLKHVGVSGPIIQRMRAQRSLTTNSSQSIIYA